MQVFCFFRAGSRRGFSFGLSTASVLVAALLGGLLGYEREQHGKSAGVRTHMLVAIGAALFVLIPQQAGASTADLTRVLQGLIAGVGFLGAGAIILGNKQVETRGLTTAASIWITAALGILYGIGFYFPALISTAAVLGTLALFRWIEYRVPSQAYAHLVLRYTGSGAPVEDTDGRVSADATPLAGADMAERPTAGPIPAAVPPPLVATWPANAGLP